MKLSFSRIAFFFWLLLVFINVSLLILVIIAPVLQENYSSFSVSIYAAFAAFCHQVPERCFSLTNGPLAICARCLGIMSGFLIGILLYPKIFGWHSLKILPPGWLIGFSLPSVLDILGNFFLLWSTTNWPRFSIGLGFGVIWPFYFFPSSLELLIKIKNKSSH